MYCYVTQRILLFIFSLCILYVSLTNDLPLAKTRINCLVNGTCFQTQPIKNKMEHRNYSVKAYSVLIHSGKYGAYYIKKNMEITMLVC